jgi:enoyl-CoA hydratase
VGLSAAEMGSSYFLPRLIGLSRAAEILYTGREVFAEEAERIGFVSRVVSEGKLRDVALDLARTMLGKSPFGLRMTKEVLNQSIDAPGLEAALALENRTQNLGVLTGDFKVAVDAFRNKERPSYPPEA